MPTFPVRILEATPNWLLNVPFNAQVYLPKENWLVYVATTYTPLREDWGRIGLRIGNQTQQWDVHPDGTGGDGSQCILPVERTIRFEEVEAQAAADSVVEQLLTHWDRIGEVAHRVNQRLDGLNDQMVTATGRVQTLGQALEPNPNVVINYILQGRAADELAFRQLYQVDYSSLEARLVSEVLAMNNEVSRLHQELTQPSPPTRFERIEKDE